MKLKQVSLGSGETKKETRTKTSVGGIPNSKEVCICKVYKLITTLKNPRVKKTDFFLLETCFVFRIHFFLHFLASTNLRIENEMYI